MEHRENKERKRIDWFLVGIALLSAFLNIYNIWTDKYVNPYYTSAVASMMQSFHNFFFASFDPGGFVTVDKPPVTFWVQTIFAKVFGLHGWSVILPQALANIGSVLLVYSLVKPSFGKIAARLASLVMACTPVAVAVSRTNNVDGLLVFTLLLATWMLFRAVKKQKWVWAVAAFAMIGLGFNEKMLEAYMVLPAFYLFYLVAFKTNWKKKLGILAGATAALLIISFSWALVVDNTSPDKRPYIGSSQTNSVFELAFGYNGVSRLTGMNRGGDRSHSFQPGQMPNQQQLQELQQQWQNNRGPQGSASANVSNNNGTNSNGTNGNGMTQNPNGNSHQMPNIDGNRNRDWNGRSFGGHGGGGMFNTGQAGPLRLFQSALSGQASWLLPFALLASIGLLAGVRRGKKLTSRQKETVFWLAWLLPVAAFFSIAGFFHQYYLIMLAPPIAALAGAGWVELLQLYRNKKGWTSWLLPLAIFVTTGFELYILQPYIKQISSGWSIGIGAIGVCATLVLVVIGRKEKLVHFSALGGILVLLVAPLYWAATPLLYGGNSSIPYAGPELKSTGRGGMPGMPAMSGKSRMPGMSDRGETINTKLVDYLTKHNTGEKYLFATTNANTAAPYIIETGKAVMAMGGFSGSDPILTVDKLEQMVKNKEVKYFLIPSGGSGGFGFGGPDGGDSQVLNWIREHSTKISSDQWQSTNPSDADQSGMGMRMGGSMALYEIKS
jgi:4-amino-4-deoxy-L-arabinose transferase-like glycosyltransferase